MYGNTVNKYFTYRKNEFKIHINFRKNAIQ
jgi:hypothetical protein